MSTLFEATTQISNNKEVLEESLSQIQTYFRYTQDSYEEVIFYVTVICNILFTRGISEFFR
jgi:hypothetical protein